MMLLLHPSLHAAITARLHWSASHELLTQLSIRISVSLEILSALDSGSCADELQMGCFETAHASSADAGACCTAGIENTNSEISIKPWPSLIDVSPTVCVCVLFAATIVQPTVNILQPLYRPCLPFEEIWSAGAFSATIARFTGHMSLHHSIAVG